MSDSTPCVIATLINDRRQYDLAVPDPATILHSFSNCAEELRSPSRKYIAMSSKKEIVSEKAPQLDQTKFPFSQAVITL
jgi:hypothetical protein